MKGARVVMMVVAGVVGLASTIVEVLRGIPLGTTLGIVSLVFLLELRNSRQVDSFKERVRKLESK